MPEKTQNIRLQLYLARCGIASRRKCGAIVTQGKVKVNDVVINEPFFKIDPSRDNVTYLDVEVKPPLYSFYKMYKPVGYVTTMSDERGRKSIANLIPPELGRLFPVGRLDKDSEGLIILTNYGEAANRMTHPRYQFMKVYNVRLDHAPLEEHLREMSMGVELDDGKTIPAMYEQSRPGSTNVRVIIMEGRKRQIRRVFELYGYKVVRLKRTSMGPIHLGRMSSGQVVRFSMKEVIELLDALGLSIL